MAQALAFWEIVEAVDQLSADEQETLVEIVKKRRIEAERARIMAEVEQSRKEYAEGKCRHMTVDEIMNEVLS